MISSQRHWPLDHEAGLIPYIEHTKMHGKGRDSVGGIATGYGLDGPGIESRGGELFHTHPDHPRGLPCLPIQLVPGQGEALTTHPHPAPRLKKE